MVASLPLYALLVVLLAAGTRAVVSDHTAGAADRIVDISAVSAEAAGVPAVSDTPLAADPSALDAGAFGAAMREAVADLEVDLAKIRARQEVLFLFLTLDLPFLTRVTDEVARTRAALTNPVATAARPATRPPLVVSGAALQAIVDRAWSRRRRWLAFREMATLIGAHDANTGAIPAMLRGYLDQNILQPFCDGATRDRRFWAMLENVADHSDFVDFVRSFARSHPSSRATTEMLFLLDELAQASRDTLLMLLETDPSDDLPVTRSEHPAGFALAASLQQRYGTWLWDRGLDERGVRDRFDDVRLRLLDTILQTTPSGYRSGDARLLAGAILFRQHRRDEARALWREMTIAGDDTYAAAARGVLGAVAAGDDRGVIRYLDNIDAQWRVDSIERLRQFGHRCGTY